MHAWSSSQVPYAGIYNTRNLLTVDCISYTLPEMIVRTWCRILLPTIQMETTQTCSTN